MQKAEREALEKAKAETEELTAGLGLSTPPAGATLPRDSDGRNRSRSPLRDKENKDDDDKSES